MCLCESVRCVDMKNLSCHGCASLYITSCALYTACCNCCDWRYDFAACELSCNLSNHSSAIFITHEHSRMVCLHVLVVLSRDCCRGGCWLPCARCRLPATVRSWSILKHPLRSLCTVAPSRWWSTITAMRRLTRSICYSVENARELLWLCTAGLQVVVRLCAPLVLLVSALLVLVFWFQYRGWGRAARASAALLQRHIEKTDQAESLKKSYLCRHARPQHLRTEIGQRRQLRI